MNKEQVELLGEVYERYWNSVKTSEYDGSGPTSIKLPTLMKEEFINKIMTDPEFANEWDVIIYTRELSLEERRKLYLDKWTKIWGSTSVQFDKGDMDNSDIPTMMIGVYYKNNDKGFESYLTK